MLISGIFFSHSLPYFLRQALSLHVKLTDSPDLLSREIWGSTCLCQPIALGLHMETTTPNVRPSCFGIHLPYQLSRLPASGLVLPS